MRSFIKLMIFFCLSVNFSCSLVKKEGTWGKDALWPIKSERVAKAFKKNISSFHVLLPLTSAAVIRWGGYDDNIAYEIAEEHHIFIDHEHADHWSDLSNELLKYQVYGSTLLTPSLESEGKWQGWAKNKVKGGVVVMTSSSVARYGRDRMAQAFPRERPNRVDQYSFPSSHATKASAYNILIHKNLDEIEMNRGLKLGFKVVSTTMAVTTGWARVEGHRHYPSDVLFGYAFGSFVSGFIYDSLMNTDPHHSFVLVPLKNRWTAQYVVQF